LSAVSKRGCGPDRPSIRLRLLRADGSSPKTELCLAIISGLVAALAMPAPGWWPLAWVGTAPLFVAMRDSRHRSAAWYGYVYGAAYFGVILFWLTIFGYLPWMLVALVASPLFIVLFAVVASGLMPGRIGGLGFVLVPAAWTAMQWLRSLGPAGFTWGSFAHTQANVSSVIQLGSLTGPWGIDFLVCAFNLVLATAFVSAGKRRFVPVAVVGSIVLVAVGSGSVMTRSAGSLLGTVKAAVIQGNLPQNLDITPQYLAAAYYRYAGLTARAADRGADFVVWPETTIPVRIDSGWDRLLSRVARGCGVGCIIGAWDGSKDPTEIREYNTAFFYDKTGRRLGVYHKVQLVPYGEYVPLRKQMPWVRRYGIRPVDVLPGNSYNLVQTDFGKVGVSICFESLFPAISRNEVRSGADMLVVMTNDSWFLRTQAARGHLMMSKLRAAENRHYVIRAAATGISTIIDPYGRSLGEVGLYETGILTANISAIQAQTPYTRVGDLFAYACAASVIIAWAAKGSSKRKRSLG